MLPVFGATYEPRRLDEAPRDFARLGLGACFKGALIREQGNKCQEFNQNLQDAVLKDID